MTKMKQARKLHRAHNKTNPTVSLRSFLRMKSTAQAIPGTKTAKLSVMMGQCPF